MSASIPVAHVATPSPLLTRLLGQTGVAVTVVGCRTPADVDANVRIARQFAAFDPQHLRRLEIRTQHYAAVCTIYKKST